MQDDQADSAGVKQKSVVESEHGEMKPEDVRQSMREGEAYKENILKPISTEQFVTPEQQNDLQQKNADGQATGKQGSLDSTHEQDTDKGQVDDLSSDKNQVMQQIDKETPGETLPGIQQSIELQKQLTAKQQTPGAELDLLDESQESQHLMEKLQQDLKANQTERSDDGVTDLLQKAEQMVAHVEHLQEHIDGVRQDLRDENQALLNFEPGAREQHSVEDITKSSDVEQRKAVDFEDYERLLGQLVDHQNWLICTEMTIAETDHFDPANLSSHLSQLQRISMDLDVTRPSIELTVRKARELCSLAEGNLDKDQEQELELLVGDIATMLDESSDQVKSRLALMTSLQANLDKFNLTLSGLDSWLTDVEGRLRITQRSVGDLAALHPQCDAHDELTEDVQSHYTDVASVTRLSQSVVSNAQRFQEKCDEFDSRHSIEMSSTPSLASMRDRSPAVAGDGRVHQEGYLAGVVESTKTVTERYNSVSEQSKDLQQRLHGVCGLDVKVCEREKELLDWLENKEQELDDVRNASANKQNHLKRIQELSADAISSGTHLFDDFKSSGAELISALHDLGADEATLEAVRTRVNSLHSRLNVLLSEASLITHSLLTERLQDLDTVEGLDELLSWVGGVESTLNSLAPLSLVESTIQEQAIELTIIRADIENHSGGVKTANSSAINLMNSMDDRVEVGRIRDKLHELNAGVDVVQSLAKERETAITEIQQKLLEFNTTKKKFTDWLTPSIASIKSTKLTQLSAKAFRDKISSIAGEVKEQLADLVILRTLARDVIGDSRVSPVSSESAHITTSLRAIESDWEELKAAVADREAELARREKVVEQFETAKQSVAAWLSVMQGKVDGLVTPAVEINLLRSQDDDLHVILEEFEDFSSSMSQLNDLSIACNVTFKTQDLVWHASAGRQSIRGRGSLSRKHSLRSSAHDSSVERGAAGGALVVSPVSSESSGVSSKQSSLDNICHVMDPMTADQQQMLSINQQYDQLGEALIDYQRDLFTAQETVAQLDADYRAIHDWLQSLDASTAARLDSLSQDEKQAIYDSLLKKEGEMTSMMVKYKHLLMNKQQAPGYETVTQQLKDLDDLLNRLKDFYRNPSSTDSKVNDFTESYARLMSWMTQKQKMTSLLTPVNCDKAMINNQIQSVELICEEMLGHSGELQRYQDLGQSIASTLEDSDPGLSSLIIQQMFSVARGWKQLEESLSESKARLACVRQTSCDYEELMDKVRNEVEGLRERVAKLPAPDGMTTSWIEDQLSICVSLQNDLEVIRSSKLSKLSDLDRDLSGLVSDLQARQALTSGLNSLTSLCDQLHKDIVSRQSALKSSEKRGKSIDVSLSQTLTWIQGKQEELGQLGEVSCDREKLNVQIRAMLTLQNEVQSKRIEVESLLDDSSSSIQQASQVGDVLDVQQLLDVVSTQWPSLLDDIDRHMSNLTDVGALSNTYHTHLSNTLAWIALMGDKMSWLEPLEGRQDEKGAGPDWGQQLTETRSLVSDMERQTPEREVLDRTGRALMDSCQADKAVVEDQLQGIDADWTNLKTDLISRMESLQGKKKTWDELLNIMADMEATLSEGETTVASSSLTKLSDLQTDLVRLSHDLNVVHELLDTLDMSTDELGDACHYSDIVERIERLNSNIADMAVQLDDAAAKRHQFEDNLDALTSSLISVEKLLSDVSATARDRAALESQLTTVESVLEVQQELEADLSDVEALLEELMSTGTMTDSQALVSQISTLQQRVASLKTLATERQSDIEMVMDRLDSFLEGHSSLMNSLSSETKQLSNKPAHNADLAAVTREIDDLAEFRATTLDSLKTDFNRVTSEGQGLVRSAQPGVTTQQIDTALSELNVHWTELNQELFNQESDHDKALLECGKVQQVLTSMLNWIGQIESMQANQRPFSIDFKSLKPQLHLQQLLIHMLSERKESYDYLESYLMDQQDNKAADAQPTDGQGSSSYHNQFEDLTQRWNEVHQTAERNQTELDALVTSSSIFHEKLEKFTNWLDGVERNLRHLEVECAELSEISQLLQQLMSLSDELLSGSADLKAVILASDELQALGSESDVAQLQARVDHVTGRYQTASGRVSDQVKRIKEIPEMIDRFYETHQEVVDWVRQIEDQLILPQSSDAETDQRLQQLQAQVDSCRAAVDSQSESAIQLSALLGQSVGVSSSVHASLNGQVKDTLFSDRQLVDTISSKVKSERERVNIQRTKSLELLTDVENLIGQCNEITGRIQKSESISSDPVKLKHQLRAHKDLVEEVIGQKCRTADILAASRRLGRSPSISENPLIFQYLDELKKHTDDLTALTNQRLESLEQALPLAEHFAQLRTTLAATFDKLDKALCGDEMSGDLLEQQDKIKLLKKDILEQKTILDQLSTTKNSLIGYLAERESRDLEELLLLDIDRYNTLTNQIEALYTDLDVTFQRNHELSSSLDNLSQWMSETASKLNHLDPVSMYVDTLKEQQHETSTLMDDINAKESQVKRLQALAASAAKSNPDLDERLSTLSDEYGLARHQISVRHDTLKLALDLAVTFWQNHDDMVAVSRELEEGLGQLDSVTLDPIVLTRQLQAFQSLSQEADSLKEAVTRTAQSGAHLMDLIHGGDRTELDRIIDEATSDWSAMNDKCQSGVEKNKAMSSSATTYNNTLMGVLVWLQLYEDRLDLIGSSQISTEQVKNSIDLLKDLSEEIQRRHSVVEGLHDQAKSLTMDATQQDAVVFMEPLNDFNKRWLHLLEAVADKKVGLQRALLALGEIDCALNELMSWLDKTLSTLDQSVVHFDEPKILDSDITSLKMLQIEIRSHQQSIDEFTEQSQQLQLSDQQQGDVTGTAEAEERLQQLQVKSSLAKVKAAERQRKLEDVLLLSRSFYGELSAITKRLKELESRLGSSRPVGMMPDTLKQQQERLLDQLSECESIGAQIEMLESQVQHILPLCAEDKAHHVNQLVSDVIGRMDGIKLSLSERGSRLEEASEAMLQFHNLLSKLMIWASATEQTLKTLPPVSRDMDVLLAQIEEHKTMQQDMSTHRELFSDLEKMKTELKASGSAGNKQDLVLMNNLVNNLGKRFERMHIQVLDRSKLLETGHKESRLFYDAWKSLTAWLDETESALDSENTTVETEPDKLRSQLHRHRELQRTLGSKQPTFDGVLRIGRSLQQKSDQAKTRRDAARAAGSAPAEEEDVEDSQTIHSMLGDLKSKWTSVCNKSVDRQKGLEDALLFAGQFRDALQLLLDWLYKVEPSLSDALPVHGDKDTVSSLIEAHKGFQKELSKRTQTISSVRQSAKQLLSKSCEETFIQGQLINLTTRWETVCRLSVNRQERLEDAYKQAEEFHTAAHGLLDQLASIERSLRYHGSMVLPDTEELVQRQIAEHELVEAELNSYAPKVDQCKRLGSDIIQSCHPDALSTVRHWLATTNERWTEVLSVAAQRKQRLMDGLGVVRARAAQLDQLMAWLVHTEDILSAKMNEPLPENIPIIEQLMHDHMLFESEIQSRHPDVEKFAAPSRRSAAGESRHVSVSRYGWKNTPRRRKLPEQKQPEPEFKSPQVAALFAKWRKVWLLSMDRHKLLQDMLDRLNEMERVRSFNFDAWRIQYMQWMKHNKSRVMDFFYRQDKDHDGKVTRQEFVDGILKSGFPTSRIEMEAVADKFDENRDGYIDYREFVAALRWPDKRDHFDGHFHGERIQDEVQHQVRKCICSKQYHIHKVEEGKYRFGESQKLRLVRILRSTVMVRVGGGWVALDEFLVKNDPCRVGLWMQRRFEFRRQNLLSKGRTNMELREQFILPSGASQTMSRFSRKTPTKGLQGSEPSSPRDTPLPRRTPTPTHAFKDGRTERGGALRAVTPTYGPVMKIREKTVHETPWRQGTHQTLDREVTRILQDRQQETSARLAGFHQTPAGGGGGARPKVSRDLPSPGLARSRGSSISSEASEGLEVFTAPRPKTRRASHTVQSTTYDHSHHAGTRAVAQSKAAPSSLQHPTPGSDQRRASTSKLPRALPSTPAAPGSVSRIPRSTGPSPSTSRPNSRLGGTESVQRSSSRLGTTSRPNSRLGDDSTSKPGSKAETLSRASSRPELDSIASSRLDMKSRSSSKPELRSAVHTDAASDCGSSSSRPSSRISQTLPTTPSLSSETVSDAGSASFAVDAELTKDKQTLSSIADSRLHYPLSSADSTPRASLESSHSTLSSTHTRKSVDLDATPTTSRIPRYSLRGEGGADSSQTTLRLSPPVTASKKQGSLQSHASHDSSSSTSQTPRTKIPTKTPGSRTASTTSSKSSKSSASNN